MARKATSQQSKLILSGIVVIGMPVLLFQQLIEAGALPYLIFFACLAAAIYVLPRLKTNKKADKREPETERPGVPARAPNANSQIKFQFICAVVGESFNNTDGTSRQAHIRKSVRTGMPAELMLEPDNPHDPTAVAVFVAGSQIGYLKRDVAQRLSDNLEFEEFSATAVVHEVHGGRGLKEHVGVTLELTVFCDEHGSSAGYASRHEHPTAPSKPTKEPADTIATLHIRYCASDGRLTERVVSVTAFDSLIMSGLCHLRRQQRSFYYDRTRTCFDVNTGEIITTPYEYLQNAYGQSVWHSLDLITEPNSPILDILLYVAKADGQLRAPERKVITAAGKVFSSDLRITEEHMKHQLASLEVMNLNAFKLAIGKFNKANDDAAKRKLLAASRAIIGTQKTVSAGEQEALDYMAERFATTETAQ